MDNTAQHKLTETFEGPYFIKEVFPSEFTYQITTEARQTKKAYYTQFKRFKQTPEYLGKEPELIIWKERKTMLKTIQKIPTQMILLYHAKKIIMEFQEEPILQTQIQRLNN